MNERIQQLALQAGLKQRIWNSLGKELPMWQEDPDNPGLEKFAELIVRECMWKIMQRKEEAIDNDWHVDEAMSAAISDISKHFGVEE